MHIRHIAPLLCDALADTPVVVINGARQSGKSTLVQSLSAVPTGTSTPRRYLTLDDTAVLSAAKSDPAGFINGLQGLVTLDEVQRAPELFLPIKAAVDRQREPGRFLLTGSADVLLLPGIADSLAGRMEVLSLWPLSSAERADSPTLNRVDALFLGDWAALNVPPCDKSELIARLASGGFPEAAARTKQHRREAWFQSYVQAVLQRDVRELANIEVDFILENHLGQITGIEVKASATVDGKDFKGLRHLQETETAIFQRGIVLYAGREVVPFGEKLWAVPLSVWWASPHRAACTSQSAA